MADAAVEFLLRNLASLLKYQYDLIGNARDEVEKLEKDLRLFKAFLKDTAKLRRKDERLSGFVREIRDVVYDAQDIVDTFITQSAVAKSANYLNRLFKEPFTKHDIGKDVAALVPRVQSMYGDKGKLEFALTSVADGDPDEDNEAPIVRKHNIVGFKDEADLLIGYLKEGKENLEVISIIGMPGQGKTTLAGMIYRDLEIEYQFPTRIWVYISQEFTRKNVLLAILKELVTTVGDDMNNKTDQELAEIVAEHLNTGNFLIVMDDVWTADDWNELKMVLPMSNKMGKILITSRNVEVGNFANPKRTPHQLRFLTPEESWLLLSLEVFGELEFPQELKVYGKIILDKCDRLPLAIVVIGGILSKKVSAAGDVIARRTMWEDVSENVTTRIVADDPTQRMIKIIALSYDKLPYNMKECFLYLGMFPEDFEILTWKLTRMWIAEGFIIQQVDISLEKTAESYLNDLINRNLLRVDTMRRCGKVKTCRIHDMIRDFCIHEAAHEKENFLQEIKWSKEGPLIPPVADIHKFRRLSIHSKAMEFFSLKPYGPSVRSFVYFSKEEINLPEESNSAISAAFKLIRVLEVQPIIFTRMLKDIDHLIHLRYIVITVVLDVLPKSLSKLWNIQTLIVNTKKRTLDIKADIWKMKHLRHLKTNASATLPTTVKSSVDAGENIRTLGTISPKSCTVGVFSRARYVKQLGILGRLAMLLEANNTSFDSLCELHHLEGLKLKNDVFPDSPSQYPLSGLPPSDKFPPKLRWLTLSGTFLGWDKMSVLGELENLEVLKLKDQAFMGESWKTVDAGFRKLEVLCIDRTDLADWMASEHHFPRLISLEVCKCEKLKQVPEELAGIPSLEVLKLHHSTSAAAAANKFRDKEQMQNSKFTLSIYPPNV